MANQDNRQLRVWWRHWSVVFILAVLAGLVIWSMLNLGPWLRTWQEQRAVAAAQKKLEELYRNDKYGGKTPEETFDMFIAALEKGDVDLASKYFVLNKQEQWRKTLEEYKTKALITDFVDELKNEKSNWEKINSNKENIAQYNYYTTAENNTVADFNGQSIAIPAGRYKNSIIFEKYLSGIWKINGL